MDQSYSNVRNFVRSAYERFPGKKIAIPTPDYFDAVAHEMRREISAAQRGNDELHLKENLTKEGFSFDDFSFVVPFVAQLQHVGCFIKKIQYNSGQPALFFLKATSLNGVEERSAHIARQLLTIEWGSSEKSRRNIVFVKQLIHYQSLPSIFSDFMKRCSRFS